MRSRFLLLGGQALALGLSVAFLVVPSAALVLHSYGAGVVPWAYLVVAVAGVAVSWSMRRAQARFSLAAVTILAIASYAVLVAAGYVLLTAGSQDWVSFALFVLFPLSIPVGFVLVGTQAGVLLDLREMKERFPRIVGGFSVGFAVGGLLAAWLAQRLGSPDDLLLLDLLPAGGMLALAVVTARLHPGQLLRRPTALSTTRDAAQRDRPWRVPLSPLVGVILGYQLLSAMVTFLLDYVVFERSAARYPHAGDLAHFTGLFDSAINVTSILFVVVVAGRLLRRFGIRLGLAANPAVVLLLLVVGNVVGWSVGTGGLLFLLVACAQLIGDISLTDGMTRTAINTTYQALPVDQRLRTQTLVEGAGVPVALGLVGGLLLLLRAAGLGVRSVELLALVITVCWLGLALAGYHQYAIGLRRLVTRRVFEPTHLEVTDDADLAACRRLLASPDPRDVEVALRALAASGGAAADLLAGDAPVGLRSISARASAGPDDDPGTTELLTLLDDPDPTVRATAATALVAAAPGQRERALETWLALARHGGPDAVDAALSAAAVSPSRALVPALVELAGRPGHGVALSQALAAHAEHLGPALRTMLVDRHGDRRVRERLARAVTAAPRRGEPVDLDLGAALDEQRERAARARAVIGVLDESPALAPLRRALRDEVAGVAAETLALVELATGHRGLTRAARSLASADPARQALAREALEVTAGGPWGQAVLELVGADEPGEPGPPAADWLADLVDDPDDLWQEPWLRACALYAAPTVAGDRAADLAAPWVDDPEPAVAETARWVLDRDVT